MTRFRTIERAVRHEPDKIKGSRHIATVEPLRDAAQADEVLTRVRKEMHDARHHAFAWRLGIGNDGSFRYSDDGEPSGSAGKPILAQIDGRELTDLMVVVTRYFGGTKLGVGGLVRAYGGAAAEALDLAGVREVVLRHRVAVTHGYEDSGAVASVLHGLRLEPKETGYGEEVRLILGLEAHRVEATLAALREATGGRARVDVGPLGSDVG
ncbi:hypothetical protein ABI59_00520 [Acidobacteria bacterium Mor1]|nr:hypothetical protein ABI59_00520 [Acidobacteria bacterium Mor1]